MALPIIGPYLRREFPHRTSQGRMDKLDVFPIRAGVFRQQFEGPCTVTEESEAGRETVSVMRGLPRGVVGGSSAIAPFSCSSSAVMVGKGVPGEDCFEGGPDFGEEAPELKLLLRTVRTWQGRGGLRRKG